ncbi:hypothetical protein KW851_09085 [Pseudomonas sp. PDM33]|nr:hypothetical protein [Pseudomonas sp. PDM33]
MDFWGSDRKTKAPPCAGLFIMSDKMKNQEDLEKELIREIHKSAETLFKELNGKSLSSTFTENIKHFTDAIELYNSPTLAPSLRGQVISNIANISANLSNIADIETKNSNSAVLATINQLSKELLELIHNKKTTFIFSPKGIAPPDSADIENDLNLAQSLSRIRQELASLKNDHEMHDERHKKLISENLINIEKISEATKNLEDNVSLELKKAQELYVKTEEELREKEDQINKLVGTISGTAVAGSYEKSAEKEKFSADMLRYSSIFCMFAIACIVAYSFWETTTETFKLENSAFRIALALILSVPSAYLARESSKHRSQQYSHLQTSLDLKAVNPFIASLPIDEQHKLKSEIASRIFSPKDISNISSDSYPINAQELILELIKKIKPKE